MPCNFSGVFYLSGIQNRSLTCHFIDECPDGSQNVNCVNMTYFAPQSLIESNGPFYEPPPMQPLKAYFITGIMAIENNCYSSPLVSPHFHLANSYLVSSVSRF